MARPPLQGGTDAVARRRRRQSGGTEAGSLKRNPAPALLASRDEAVAYFTRRDLLGEAVGPIEFLWGCPAATRALRGQQTDGSWPYHSGTPRLRSPQDYELLATYTRMRDLVEKFEMTRDVPTVRRGAERMFRSQTREGDIRGIYGTQYSPNYTAGMLELLIKSGYADDPRTRRGLRWLLAARQEDGGWAVPLRTVGAKYTEALARREPLQGDPTRPSSHLITGVVLRAFAAHPTYRRDDAVHAAAELLLSRFFRRDAYPDRSDPAFWTKFTYPFWFTDLLSSLDSLSRLGFRADDPRIAAGLRWFRDRQAHDGLWDLTLLRTGDKALRLWLGLTISRVFLRFGQPIRPVGPRSHGPR